MLRVQLRNEIWGKKHLDLEYNKYRVAKMETKIKNMKTEVKKMLTDGCVLHIIIECNGL